MSLKKKVILIIEDNTETNDLLKEIFNNMGFQVYQAFNGLSGIDHALHNSADLIILDIILPDIDGYSVCKQLKINPISNLIPIIMLTGLSEEANKSLGIRVGADCYITKPFDINNLLNEVTQLLEWKEKLKNLSCREFINIIIDSEGKHLNQLNDLISIPLERTPLSSEEIDEVKMGLLEIVTNAIEWGNSFNKELLVNIYYELFSDSLVFSIIDEGKGFDCQKYLKPNYHPVNSLDDRIFMGKRLGGFGIKIAQSFFDYLNYNKNEKKFTLKKKLIYSNNLLS